MNKLMKLDGRHKLAILGAGIGWMVSVYFSKEGFSVDAQNAQWLGWILAFIITVVELVFNSKAQRLSLTLIVVGILCYLYGIYTNITGFWSFQNPGIQFTVSQSSILSIFVGAILEILPEPLFMWGLGSEFEGDLLGNLVGLWGGDLDYAKPDNRAVYSRPIPNNTVSNKRSGYKPDYKFTSFGNINKPQGKIDPHKVVSNIFNDNYTGKLKK